MAALSEDVKAYIVVALACFDDQKQVIKDVKEKFGVAVYQQQVGAYDPNTVAGARMSKKLKKLFDDSRAKFLEDTTAIPIANAAVRLRMLQRLATVAEQRGNAAMVAQLLEQAAKEVGGAFTNKQKIDQTGVVGTMQVQAPPAAQGTVPAAEAYAKMMSGGR